MPNPESDDGPSEPSNGNEDEEMFARDGANSPNPDAKRLRRLADPDLGLSDEQEASSDMTYEPSGSSDSDIEHISDLEYSLLESALYAMDTYDGSAPLGSAENDANETSSIVLVSLPPPTLPPTVENAGAAAELGDATNEEPKIPCPPSGVDVIHAHYERQFGYSARTPPSYFCNAVMGNLNYVKRLELMHSLKGHDGCVNSLSFNRGGTRLASGSDDYNVIVWDWPTAEALVKFDTGHRLNVFQSKFVPQTNDLRIVTCARDGQVRLAELAPDGSCRATRLLARHAGTSHKLSCDPDSPNLVLSCGEDGNVFEIDMRSAAKSTLVRVGHRRNAGRLRVIPLYSIHMHPRNSNLFAVGGEDIYCHVFDRRRLNVAHSNPVASYCPESLVSSELTTAITCAVYNHSGSELLATYQDSDIHLYDATNCNRTDSIKSFKGHRNNATVKGVNFYGPYSEFVVSGSDCGHIYFWEKQTQQIVKFMPGDRGGVVNVLEPNPVCSVLATSGLDSDIKIWVPSGDNTEIDRQLLKQLTDTNTQENLLDLFESNEAAVQDMNIVYSRLRAIWSRELQESENSDSDDPLEDMVSDFSSDDNTESQVAINCRPS
uniref:WD_REPEATS_REGION domain-containing protein n=1 Tax=Trichuris muris TaxID=70415 RepID=A0A5S6QMQ9_TRIMR